MFNFRLRTFRSTPASAICCGLMLGWLSVTGCGGPEDPTIPVYGKVTLNGKPVEHGDIEFGGKENQGYRRGAMISNGEYRTAPMQGLLPGEYVVRIFSVPGGANEPAPDVMPGEGYGGGAVRDMIPPEWNMRSKQTITVTAEGTNEFNFDIVSKRK